MGEIICSSEKKEGMLPEKWYETVKQAQYLFDDEVKWYCEKKKRKKIRWLLKPEVIENNGKFNVIGFAK